MKVKSWLWVLFLLTVPVPGLAETVKAPAEESPHEPTTITVIVRHRVAASFADTLEVVWGTGEQYWIGDTEFSLEISRFVADFGISQTGEVIERSSEAHNPACEVVIYNEGIEEDRVWAFFGTGSPHFRRESMLAVDMISFPWRGSVLTEPIPRKDEVK